MIIYKHPDNDALHASISLGVTIHQHEIVAMECLDVLSEEKSMKVTFVTTYLSMIWGIIIPERYTLRLL